MKLFTIVACVLTLSACVVQPGHHHKKKPQSHLEKEHNNKAIVIVNVRPAKHKKCRQHNRHWHCKSI
jgi:uncharacterized lipoprotein YajG